MRYFSRIGFIDREGRIWFNADKFGVSIAHLSADFLELTLEMTPPILPPAITAEFQELECSASASYVAPVITGAIDAEFTSLEMGGIGFSNLLTLIIEPLAAACYGGASISVAFTEPECRMGQGYNIEGDLPSFVCQSFSEYRSKNIDNCQFR